MGTNPGAGTNVNFYKKLVYLTLILKQFMFIFSNHNNKFLKQSYNMSFWRLRSQHRDISVMILFFFLFFFQAISVVNSGGSAVDAVTVAVESLEVIF